MQVCSALGPPSCGGCSDVHIEARTCGSVSVLGIASDVEFTWQAAKGVFELDIWLRV